MPARSLCLQQKGVRQRIPVHRGHDQPHAELPLHVLAGNVVQKHVPLMPQHHIGNDENFSRLYPVPELPDQVGRVDWESFILT